MKAWIISTPQQARPKVIGQIDPVRGPIDQVLETGDEEALFLEMLGRTRQQLVLTRTRRQRRGPSRIE